ncbi:MAG: transglutaminase-like domain-containing protein, partial [Tetragenococcus koreensis]
DNFSSAMVVMLRSVGIPARWTKGFTSGEEVSEDRYVVRNSDAHSWPEVYFEGYGWLPFEPTPSFSQPLEQTDAAANDNTDSSTTNSSTTEETTETSSTQSSSTTSTESTTATETEEGTGPTNNRFLQISPFVRNILYGGLIVAILGLVYILWRNYFYLYMLVLIKINNASILKIYPKLLNRAEKFVFRTPEQPLNQYAQIFEERYPEFNGTFIKLTDSYEKSLYGSVAEVDEQERKLIFELTRKLAKIKK